VSSEETGGFETSPEKRIFLNYRRQDAPAHAGRLYEGLAERFGPGRVFRDVDAIHAGAEFVPKIEDTLDAADAILVVIGRKWLGAMGHPDDFVRLEIAYALRHHVKVIPVLVAGATMPAADELPPDLADLARLHPCELPDEDWSSGVDALVKSLESEKSQGD
jgi:hypothetical protein